MTSAEPLPPIDAEFVACLLESHRRLTGRALLAEPGGDKPRTKDYARLCNEVTGREDARLIKTLMLRSLPLAVYSNENIGHFGLDFTAYAHFTAPIRRYPDLMVHRAIRAMINRRVDSAPDEHDLHALAEHCSMTERRADEATRDAVQRLKCGYMEQHLGDEFTGVITGVAAFGIFVVLDNLFVEGMVHITSLPADYYQHDAARHHPRYPRAGQNYRIKVWALQFLPAGENSPESFVAVRLAGHTTAIDSQYARLADHDSQVEPDFSRSRTESQAKALEVYIWLDHRNILRECREDNNEYVYRYTVYSENEPMANLAFKGYVAHKPGQLVNRDAALWGEIVNKGNGESRPFWLEFDCEDNRDAKTRKVQRMRVNQLIQPGGVLAFNTAMRWDNPGLKVCIVRLDPEDEDIESGENDNEHIGLTLQIDEPPPVK